MKTHILVGALTVMLGMSAVPAIAGVSAQSFAYAEDGIAAKFVAGIVTAKTETELTVKEATGDPVTIVITDKTKFMKAGLEAKADEVKVDSTVLVTVKTNDDGKKEAAKVTITESPKPAE